MAPSQNRDYFAYLEDYIAKERNLKFLMKKISKHFIVQEAFRECMLRNDVFQARELNKQPYLTDFLLVEYLDSIWINEVYRSQRENLIRVVSDVIEDLHTLDKFRELSEKRNTIRKVVNTIHQTEYILTASKDFLSISLQEEAAPTRASIHSQNSKRPNLS